uniref:Uncharacterized protein n=1 Tax=Rhodopseudomonas palustris (strain ATCC BAA-98 / CGA009) TaxID=258594 RepID=Q6N4L0_RHOPA|nr:hypothetical protein RPA3327 [Rhodopseudomonas palustris CGA009]
MLASIVISSVHSIGTGALECRATHRGHRAGPYLSSSETRHRAAISGTVDMRETKQGLRHSGRSPSVASPKIDELIGRPQPDTIRLSRGRPVRNS